MKQVCLDKRREGRDDVALLGAIMDTGTKIVGAASGAAIGAGFAVSQPDVSDLANFAKLGDVGPWMLLIAVVTFVFYGIFKGWIIPRPHYDTLMARAIAAEETGAELSKTNAILVNINDVQARTIEKQTAVGDTVEKVMGAIQNARTSAGGTP